MCQLHGHSVHSDELVYIPFDEVNEQHPGRFLHGLDKHTGPWGHGRVGQLKRVEVHDSIQDPVGCGGSGTDENGQAVQGGIYDKSIAIARVGSLVEYRSNAIKVQIIPAVILKHT